MATSKKAASKKAAGKKKAADKKPAAKKATPAKSGKATTKKAARASTAPKPAVTKKPKSRPVKEKAKVEPSLTQTVNMGPQRGDNSFPPSNKPVGIPGSQGKRGQRDGGKGGAA